MLRYSVVLASLQSHGLWPARLLCLWDFPGKNTRVACHFLFQGIFLTQGSKLHLLHLMPWKVGSLPLSHLILSTKRQSLTPAALQCEPIMTVLGNQCCKRGKQGIRMQTQRSRPTRAPFFKGNRSLPSKDSNYT